MSAGAGRGEAEARHGRVAPVQAGRADTSAFAASCASG